MSRTKTKRIKALKEFIEEEIAKLETYLKKSVKE